MSIYYVEYNVGHGWGRWYPSRGTGFYGSYNSAKRVAGYITNNYIRWYPEIEVRIYSVTGDRALLFENKVTR